MKKSDKLNKDGISGGDHARNRKRNEKRIGGKGLSLEAFANAKSMTSGYNPSLIKKQREFYKNAKYISKFKKLIKQESQFSESHHHSLPIIENSNEDENAQNSETIHRKKKKKKASLKAFGEEVEKKRAEAEKARLEREAELRAKKAQRERAEAKRKSLRDNMFKRTRSGQPVMKYRIQHLLDGLLGKL